MKGKFTRWIAVLAVAGWSRFSDGAVILEYVGNDFTEFFNDGPTSPPVNYQQGDHITAWVELPDVLGPNLVLERVYSAAFVFMDGRQAIDNITATNYFFTFSTDDYGVPTSWHVFANVYIPEDGGGTANPIEIVNRPDHPNGAYVIDEVAAILCGPSSVANNCELFGDPYYWQGAAAIGNAGIWSYREVSPVPLPAAAWLLGSALLGLGATKRKKT